MNFSIQAETTIMGMVMYRNRKAGKIHPRDTTKQAIVVLGISPITSQVESMLPLAKKKNAHTYLPVFLGHSRSSAKDISGAVGKSRPRRMGQKESKL